MTDRMLIEDKLLLISGLAAALRLLGSVDRDEGVDPLAVGELGRAIEDAVGVAQRLWQASLQGRRPL